MRHKEEYSKFLTTITGLKSLPLVHKVDQSRRTENWVARTVDDCSVHLNVAGLVDVDAELKKNADKLKKLVKNLNQLENTMSSPSYSANAPLQVQEAHRAKLAMLRNEINQLENIGKNLKA